MGLESMKNKKMIQRLRERFFFSLNLIYNKEYIMKYYLTKKRMIDILKEMEAFFRLKPNRYLENHSGLCFYLKHRKGCSIYHIKKILQTKYKNMYYTFCKCHCQDMVYEIIECRYMKYDRANWCKKRIEELERELKEKKK